MTDYYVDPTAQGSGSGTRSDPYQSFSSISSLSSGDGVFAKAGTTINSTFPTALLAANNLRFGVYGGSRQVIVDCGVSRSGFTYLSGADVWRIGVTVSPGCVREDGSPMNWVEWDTDLSTTRAKMTPGTWTSPNIWTGSWATNVIYLVPSTKTPLFHQYVVAESIAAMTSSAVQSGLRVEGWEFWGGSMFGAQFVERTNVQFIDCGFRYVGGAAQNASTTLIGNGLELAYGCDDFVVNSCYADEVFDSGFSPQAWTASRVIRNGVISNSVASACGLAGIEVSLTLGSGVCGLTGIRIDKNNIERSGRGWSGIRYGQGIGIGMFSNVPGATAQITNSSVSRNVIANCNGTGISTYRLNGDVTVFNNEVKNCVSGYQFRDNLSASGYVASTYVYSGNRAIKCDTGYRIGLDADVVSSQYFCEHNVATNCQTGISIGHSQGTATVQNNIVINSAVDGIAKTGSGSIVKNNNVLHNNTANYSGGIVQGTDVLSDPLFGDYFLPEQQSPARNAGITTAAARNGMLCVFTEKTPTIGARK